MPAPFADIKRCERSRAHPTQNRECGKLEIIKRNELHRIVVLSKRWIVERSLAWISHNRRLARYFERSARSASV
jgi:hypothetical protein